MWQMLMALKECELKNDGLLDIFYEVIGKKYQPKEPYAVYFFHGNYDVPLKAGDGESLWESEEVYRFIICAICQVHGDYKSRTPNYSAYYVIGMPVTAVDFSKLHILSHKVFKNLFGRPWNHGAGNKQL